MTQAAPPSLQQPSRTVLHGLLDRRPVLGTERAVEPADDAVARGLATAKVYAFASVDFPGAATSLIVDSNGTTAVGGFDFDPADTKPITAFTFAGGAYEIFTIPNSTASLATGVNAGGVIIGLYEDLSGVLHGFAKDASGVTDVDFPGATGTQAIGINGPGQIVGSFFDAANVEHGFVSSGGAFTAIDFPGATRTTAFGINAAGDVVGGWSDAAAAHGFLPATVTTGGELTLEQRARIRAAGVWVTARSVAVVEAAYRSGGGSSIYR